MQSFRGTAPRVLAGLLIVVAVTGLSAPAARGAPPEAVAPDGAIAPTSAPVPTSTSNARVYVINGGDPLGLGGLSGTSKRIRAAGYSDTHYVGCYQGPKVEREIRALHRQDPSVPVVVIGYSLGAYTAKSVANRLTRDGIPVAMVGYIGGDYLSNTTSSQLPGVGRVVNVRGDGFLVTGGNLFFNGADLTGAENLRLRGVRHLALPKSDEAVAALLSGMDAATGRQSALAGAPTTDAPASATAETPPAAPVADGPAQAARPTSRTRLVDRRR